MSNSPPFNHAPLTLRDYQIDIVDQLDELDHPLVPLPTGAGKTVELAQVTRGRSAHARNFTLEEKRRFHIQLLWIAKERSRKPGWAAYTYKDKFAAWPDAKPWALPEPEPPSPALRTWVRSRDIAYAKAMGASR